MVYLYHSFLIHLSVDGHLGCFHVLAIINSAAMNTGYTCLFQVWFPRCVCPAVGLSITFNTLRSQPHYVYSSSSTLASRITIHSLKRVKTPCPLHPASSIRCTSLLAEILLILKGSIQPSVWGLCNFLTQANTILFSLILSNHAAAQLIMPVFCEAKSLKLRAAWRIAVSSFSIQNTPCGKRNYWTSIRFWKSTEE